MGMGPQLILLILLVFKKPTGGCNSTGAARACSRIQNRRIQRGITDNREPGRLRRDKILSRVRLFGTSEPGEALDAATAANGAHLLNDPHPCVEFRIGDLEDGLGLCVYG